MSEDTGWVCGNCGGKIRGEPSFLLLDPNYGDGNCPDCAKHVTLVRADVFDRRKWEAQRQQQAQQEAIRKATKKSPAQPKVR